MSSVTQLVRLKEMKTNAISPYDSKLITSFFVSNHIHIITIHQQYYVKKCKLLANRKQRK